LFQPVNARSQGCNLRPKRFQFILWVGHAGKLSHLPSQRKGFVLLKVGVLRGGEGIYACVTDLPKCALAAEAISMTLLNSTSIL
jgi:hypothetical protein